MDTFLRDARLALRVLRRRAGFTALAVSILALAIGANTAIFSVVEGVLLRAPAFREPDRLVLVWERNTVRNRDRNVVGPYNFTRWRERNRAFEDLAAFVRFPGNLTGAGDPERLDIGFATGNLFDLFGARPLIGRSLVDSDSRPGAPRVAVLAEGFWRRRFGGDPGLVGRSLNLNGEPTTVVGVVPRGFQVPPDVALWAPINIGEEMRNARGRWMIVAGRLKQDVTLAQARDEMLRLHADLVRENPDFNTGWSASVYPLHADLVRDVRPALYVLMGAVGLLLLVACANVANLMLARAVAREREVAIRAAIGASPARLAWQLLTESLLLGLAGGAVGLLLALWVLQALVALLPAEVRAVSEFGLNRGVLAFTLAVSVACTLLFGLVPALQQARPSLVPALKEGGGTRGAARGRRRLKSALVVGEVALSLVLTAGTGVMLRSFWRLAHVDPGFESKGVITVPVQLAGSAYQERRRQAEFYRDAVARLERIPGVRAAAAISWMPLTRLASATRYRALDRPLPEPGQEPVAEVRIVTPGLFRTMGVSLLAGRDFQDQDVDGRPGAVIVSRALAEEQWPGQDAIGKRITMSWSGDPEAEVVGVASDVRLNALDTIARPTLYWPSMQVPNGFMTLMLRTDGPPEALAGAVRAEVAAIDPEVPLGRFRALGEIVAESIERQRFLLRLLGAFAGLALVLAAVGVYGVMSFVVLERVPEVGVRLALGASPGDIVRLVLREGLLLGASGVGVGLLVAVASAGVLRNLVFEISPRDPTAFLAVAALLLAAALAAAWLPARRAARVDPLTALRGE